MKGSSNLRMLCIALIGLAVTACSTLPGGSGNWRATTGVAYSDDAETCLDFFRTMQSASERAGYAGAKWTVPGFPYLRSNRFLASFSNEVDTREEFDEWVFWLGEAADTSIIYERELAEGFNSETHELCRNDLIELDFASETGRDALRHAVHAPDSYADWKRVLGVYPLTRAFMAWGFNRWKYNYAEMITSPFDVQTGVRYTLAPSSELTAFTIEEAKNEIDLARQASALGIPYLSERLFQRLAITHAPTFVIATDEPFDRIGTPELTNDLNGAKRIKINTDKSQTFVRFDYARFEGDVLPQITYMVWFKERPKDGPFDLIGGDLDALMWRVTIGKDGRPLVYDSAHACGCYHLFFPVPPTKRKPMPQDDDLREEALVPFKAPLLLDHERLVVKISSRDHYVVGLEVEARQSAHKSRKYAIKGPVSFHGEVFGQDGALHMMPVDGRVEDLQSIYGRNGIIAQSARLERWLLWPSGIASPGAMRAWGQHATSFVGKRHFDDPYLLEEAFEQ